MTWLYQKMYGINKLTCASVHQWVVQIYEFKCSSKWSQNLNVCDQNECSLTTSMHVASQFYSH